MNKKAVAPFIIWAIVIIIGILLATQTDFFATFIPSVGQPAGTDSLVNPGYYDVASPVYDFECPLFPIIVRAEDNIFGSSGWIVKNNNGVLTGYVYDSIVTDPSLGSPIPLTSLYYNSGLNKIFAFNGSFVTYGPCTGYRTQYGGCVTQASGGCCRWAYIITHYNYYSYVLGTSGIPSDAFYATPNENYYEVYDDGDQGINPYINIEKYACRNGDVVSQHCNNFLEDYSTLYSCLTPQTCTFLSNQQVPEGFADIVKCNNLYRPNQALCVGNVLYTTNSQGSEITSIPCGYSCVDGECIDCQSGTRRCTQNPEPTTDIEICINGEWTDWTDPAGNCIGEEQCVNGECTTDFVDGQERCQGLQPQIFSSSTQTWSNNGESCDLNCIMQGDTATCQLQCVIGYFCSVNPDIGVLQQCIPSDRDNEQTSAACFTGHCLQDQTKCMPFRPLGEKYCSGGDVWNAVSSGNPYDIYGGVIGQLFRDCVIGCEIVNEQPSCILAEGCSGYEGLAICTNSITKKVCSQDGQTYTSTEDCSAIPGGYCEVVNGVGTCRTPPPQCTGNSICSGSNIFACNNGQIGEIINNCNGLGCYTDSNNLPQCSNECPTVGAYQCQEGDSYQCIRNLTTNQNVLVLENICGSGCDSISGRCNYVGEPGDYICGGINSNQIFLITETQELQLIDTCGSGGSYCSPGINYCKYCEQGALFCDDTDMLICENEQTGETSLFNSCPAGCFVGNQNSYCDQVQFTIISVQNFLINENVIITIRLRGSDSQNGIQTSGTATITGDNEPRTANSGTNGIMNFGFGIKPIGVYTVTINIPEFDIEEIINVRVSNDYQIRIYGSPVVMKIPGTTPKAQIEAKDANGNAPDSVSVYEAPSEISVDVRPTTISGRWDLIVDGDIGIYRIELRADELEPQEVTVELVEPELTIESGIPASDRIGQRQYDLTVKAPTSSGALANIVPGTIIANVNNNVVTLLDRGGGKYTLDYNFASEGTYTIGVEASKEGYESAVGSFTVQMSQSGTTPPPGGAGGAGNQTGIGVGTGLTGFASGIPWYVWIGGGIVIVYWLSRRKKR